MEAAKKPEVLLGVSNSAAIIGVSVYFYKQINALKEEVSELTEHLKTSVNKFANIQNDLITKDDLSKVVKSLIERMEETQQKIKSLDTGNDDVETIEEALELLSDTLLSEAGVSWDYPPKRKRRSKNKSKKSKKGGRRKKYSSSESSELSSEDSDSDIESSIAQVRSKKSKSRKK
jgi:hypothetical protein